MRPKTVRIELPWSIFCGHCEAHVAKGVRFNARKQEIGAYHSTKIFEFSMTCHLCSGPIVIKTDPENRDYAVVSGAKRKQGSYEADDAQVINLPDEKVKKRMASDALFKLEFANDDRESAKSKDKELEKLVSMRDDQFRDDYASSQMLRSTFRKKKKSIREESESNRRKGIHVDLVPERQEDVLLALSTKFGRRKSQTRQKPKSSIFKK